MKKRIVAASAVCLLLLAFLLSACSFAADDRIGTYTDGGIYSMTLEASGRGVFVYHSAVEGDITEEIFFDIRKDGMLYIQGTADGGGVIGRVEYSGKIEGESGKYTVTLRNTETGVPLSSFYQTAQ